MTKGPKDRWDKAEIILKAAAGVIAALTIATFGYFGSCYLNTKESTEMRTRLYTELISRREQAESDLRKDMFTSIIGSFLKPDSSSLDARILELELLSYNFHESLILKPLFIYFEKRIDDSVGLDKNIKDEYKNRLHKVAREITGKQTAILESGGDKIERFFDASESEVGEEDYCKVDFELEVENTKRYMSLKLVDIYKESKEVEVRLEIEPIEDDHRPVEKQFTVGFFDFPMIDNLRLSKDQRCAVVLNEFEDSAIALTVICFPGSYASLREKPYFNEMIDKLVGKKEAEKDEGIGE